MARPAKDAIAPERLLPFQAEGFSLTPPGLWDLAQFRFGEQNFRDGGLFIQFDDLLRERLIFRWYNKKADPKMMAVSYVANLAQEVKRNLPPGVPAPEIVPGPFQEVFAPSLTAPIVKCTFKSGELLGRIYTFPWPDPAVPRTVLICLAYSAAENNATIEDLERRLLDSLSYQPASDTGTRSWSVGGLLAQLPGYFQMWEADAYAGQFKLVLRPEKRFLKQHPGEELVLFRSGLAALTMARSSLHAIALEWLKGVQGPRSPKFDESPGLLNLHNTPSNPVTKLAARAKTISRRARGDYLLGVVRHRPDQNALTGVFWFAHRKIAPERFAALESTLALRTMEAADEMPALSGLPPLKKMVLPDLDAKGRPMITRPWQWRTIVLRNPSAGTEEIHDGLRLRLPVKPTKMTGLIRRFSGMGNQTLPDRVIELDGLGAELWNQFDGKTDLWTITAAFSNRHHVSIRESERLIWQHLQNMVKRGIIGLAIPRLQEQETLFENAGAQ
ncbi:MAG TPA: hypothetical protein VL860_08120 [Planctomycetota bacterium]|nr:hypothetical protein [Planctomycetota bacterium]